MRISWEIALILLGFLPIIYRSKSNAGSRSIPKRNYFLSRQVDREPNCLQGLFLPNGLVVGVNITNGQIACIIGKTWLDLWKSDAENEALRRLETFWLFNSE